MKNKDTIFIYISCILILITEVLKYQFDYYFGATNILLLVLKGISYISLALALVIIIIYSYKVFKKSDEKTLKFFDLVSTIFLLCNFISGAIIMFLPFKFSEDYKEVRLFMRKKEKTKVAEVEVKSKPKWVYISVIIVSLVLSLLPLPKSLDIVNMTTGMNYGELIYGSFIFLVLGLLYYDEVYDTFAVLFKNIRKYFYLIIKYILLIISVNIVFTLIIKLISGEHVEYFLISNNNLSHILLSLLYLPIIEELVFRLSLKKIMNSKWIFIICSSLLYGLFSAYLLDLEIGYFLLYTLFYFSYGFVLSYNYEKYNNIAIIIFLHFVVNILANIY